MSKTTNTQRLPQMPADQAAKIPQIGAGTFEECLNVVRNGSGWGGNGTSECAAKLKKDVFGCMDSLVQAARAEGRNLHASECRSYDAMEEVLDELSAIENSHRMDRSAHPGLAGPPERLAYVPGAPLAKGQTFEGYTRARNLIDEDHDNLSLGKYLRGMATGNWDGAHKERMALSEGTDALGGFLVPTILSGRIIDMVRNKTRVMQAGASLVPMESRKLDVPKWVGDPTAAWHSENAAISPSDATLGKVTLTAQALAANVEVSWELLEDAPDVQEQLLEAFAAAFALKIDLAALYGTGTAPEPRGVKNTAGVTQTSMGANGAALTSYDTLVDAVGRIEDANEEATGIIYAGRTARALSKLKDTTNQPLSVPEYIAEVPRYSTKQVPTNLTVGTSTDTSDIFTADWRQLLIGVRTQLQVRVLKERYADNGQAGFIAWWRGDVAVARTSAFDIVTGVR